jgi:hypothetical protein
MNERFNYWFQASRLGDWRDSQVLVGCERRGGRAEDPQQHHNSTSGVLPENLRSSMTPSGAKGRDEPLDEGRIGALVLGLLRRMIHPLRLCTW